MAWVSAQITPCGGPRSPGWVPEVGSALDSPREAEGKGLGLPQLCPLERGCGCH